MNEIHQMPDWFEGYLGKINAKLDKLEAQMEKAASTPPPLFNEPLLPSHAVSPEMTTYLINRSRNSHTQAPEGVSPLMLQYLKSKNQNP